MHDRKAAYAIRSFFATLPFFRGKCVALTLKAVSRPWNRFESFRFNVIAAFRAFAKGSLLDAFEGLSEIVQCLGDRSFVRQCLSFILGGGLVGGIGFPFRNGAYLLLCIRNLCSVSAIRDSSNRLKYSVFLAGGTLMTSMLSGYYPTMSSCRCWCAAAGKPLFRRNGNGPESD